MKSIKFNILLTGLIFLTNAVYGQKNFDVQSIGIDASFSEVFEYVSKPQNLPLWTNAFSKADDTTAVMVTPNGGMNIKLKTLASKVSGTIDWYMTMPDGSIGKAFSRVTENNNGKSVIYSFVLMAPPVPLEQLEGALSAQKEILAEELKKLRDLLENE